MEGRTRGRLSGAVIALVWAAAAIGISRASVGPLAQGGTFALVDGTSQIISKLWAEHDAGLTASLHIRQFRPNHTAPIRDYDAHMQKLMHLIIVRDDFATFSHVHPVFDQSTGTFTQTFTKEGRHRYYVYADTEPRGLGQQVFRFTIESDGAPGAWRPSWRFSSNSSAGPYTVTLAYSTFAPNRAQSIDLTILKAGRPAGDLRPYLGAAAHAVLINTATLRYAHVHPMVRGTGMTMSSSTEMSNDDSALAGPAMQMNLPPLPAGIYKLWIDFKGANDAVYTAPFTLRAQ